jgi:tRNA threonylcarbamoyladenosine biosynthesis protein TsaE
VKIRTRSPEETKEAGFRLGRALRKGQTVGLYGELGAGKTVFVKGIARALGVEERDVMSASFTVITEYMADPPLYHIDLYRIEGEKDLESTGVEDFLGGDGIAVIEWAEKIELEGLIKVTIGFADGDEREITIEGAETG